MEPIPRRLLRLILWHCITIVGWEALTNRTISCVPLALRGFASVNGRRGRERRYGAVAATTIMLDDGAPDPGGDFTRTQ